MKNVDTDKSWKPPKSCSGCEKYDCITGKCRLVIELKLEALLNKYQLGGKRCQHREETQKEISMKSVNTNKVLKRQDIRCQDILTGKATIVAGCVIDGEILGRCVSENHIVIEATCLSDMSSISLDPPEKFIIYLGDVSEIICKDMNGAPLSIVSSKGATLWR